ncbi:MAG TPA: hypothetical protein VM529_15005, partial [Gemmata sp.]|nr:hypothetical protein [Gemmata sp.]
MRRALVRLVPTALVLSLGLAAAAVPTARKPQPAAKDAPTLYVNATIHAGTGEKPLEKAYLLVKGGKIEDVGEGKP